MWTRVLGGWGGCIPMMCDSKLSSFMLWNSKTHKTNMWLFCVFWTWILVVCRWVFLICVHVFMCMTFLVLVVLGADLGIHNILLLKFNALYECVEVVFCALMIYVWWRAIMQLAGKGSKKEWGFGRWGYHGSYIRVRMKNKEGFVEKW